MSFNTFGHLFRVTTFGESHGPAIGCVVDGCPPRIPLTEADIQPYLDKRRPGQSRFTTQRQEPDTVKILSGVFADEATGAAGHHRHADRAADRERRPALEGLFRHQGHLSAGPRRLHLRRQIRLARLSRRRPRLGARDRDAGRGRRHRPQDRAGPQRARRADPDRRADDRSRAPGTGPRSSAIRSSVPDAKAAAGFADYLDGVRKKGSSVGAIIEVVAEGVPAGLGAPVYGKLDGDLAGALMGINAVKGVEIGAGFAARRAVGRGQRRRDAHGQRRQAAVSLQQRRRHPGRHLDRPAGGGALCGQADLVDPDAAQDRRPLRQRDRGRRPRAATIHASASGRCRSARPWWPA